MASSARRPLRVAIGTGLSAPAQQWQAARDS
jgi:hypothetical protein